MGQGQDARGGGRGGLGGGGEEGSTGGGMRREAGEEWVREEGKQVGRREGEVEDSEGRRGSMHIHTRNSVFD